MSMDLDELVQLVSLYCHDNGETLEQREGENARLIAEEIVELLEEQLSDESPFGALWRDFKAAPQANSADLKGALEVIEEANPSVRERLAAFYEGYDYDIDTGEIEPDEYGQMGETVQDESGRYVRVGGDLSEPSAEAARTDQIPMDPDERERYNEEEVDSESLRHPYYPDYVDESNLYLVGDRGDDQSTSPIMYFDEDGSSNADYSAISEEEAGDWSEEDSDTGEERDDIA